jgi:hypothetical protein
MPLVAMQRKGIRLQQAGKKIALVRRLPPNRRTIAEYAGRMHYRTVAQRGWPIGSGPVESACLQRQGRFKRSGQFWTPRGLRHLAALIESRQNGHWDALWHP